jgi:hypothetical protein
MRTTVMEDAQGSYNHEEEFRGLHVSMGNAETKSNGRREEEPVEWDVTMRSLQREVQRYREDNEKIMKSQEEILQSQICCRGNPIKTLAQSKQLVLDK